MLRYVEQQPDERLRAYVECVWMAWEDRRRTDRAPERIVPDACPELIVHLADRFARYRGKRWVVQPRAFLAGTLSRPWALRAGPRVRTLGIRFRPGAVSALFPLDMKHATDREVELGTLIGTRAARDFTRELRVARGRRAQLRLAETWLLGRLSESSSISNQVTRPAVRMMLRSRGRLRIEAVAASMNVSRRRLERHFARDLGIRPKLFARIVRLNAALARLEGKERGRIVDLALEAGYFDQAHLSREFRAVVGRRPGADRNTDGEMSRHFTRPDRLLTLLAGE